MKQNICQSCGMPLEKEDDFGTNANGSKSEEYCFHARAYSTVEVSVFVAS